MKSIALPQLIQRRDEFQKQRADLLAQRETLLARVNAITGATNLLNAMIEEENAADAAAKAAIAELEKE